MTMFSDEDFIEIDAEAALEDYKAGNLTQRMTYDTLRELGFSEGEIVARIHDAMQIKWDRRVRDLRSGARP